MALTANRAIHDEEIVALLFMTLSEKFEFKRMLNQEKITLSTKLNVQGRSKPKPQSETLTSNSTSQDCYKRYSFESRAT
ncbi:hypothetical protein BHYA_0078g00200 [Botrytis hyacinthi]|uniref:Uncharacterized protein n=1 Tax=Botrytis hyacinthi TaxID=278943 RepID=A0A4Z1GPJ4_9HELO|nr:hypothetical protein BHYA_0078g00200 [Botrytis hyacinthi]